MIEGKIGELISKIPLGERGPKSEKEINSGHELIKGKHETLRDQGIDPSDAWRAQRIHEHPEVVEEVIRETA